MSRGWPAAVFLILLVAVVVSVDIFFFRHHVWLRLMVNIGIVLVFISLYLRFFKQT